MSVISVRLNKKEEHVLSTLTSFFNEDKSSLIKHSLNEMYEDFVDKKEIETFEKKERQGNIQFISSDDILKSIIEN